MFYENFHVILEKKLIFEEKFGKIFKNIRNILNKMLKSIARIKDDHLKNFFENCLQFKMVEIYNNILKFENKFWNNLREI